MAFKVALLGLVLALVWDLTASSGIDAAHLAGRDHASTSVSHGPAITGISAHRPLNLEQIAAALPIDVPKLTAVPEPSGVDRLIIPAIGVDAHIEDVGLTAGHAVGVPANIWDVAWYDQGPSPGQPGNALIDGHLDWYTGIAVFWRLDQLRPGALIYVVLPDRSRQTWTVASMTWYPYTADVPSLFVTTGPPTLSLITCAGSWNSAVGGYSQRLVIRANLKS